MPKSSEKTNHLVL